MPDISALDFTQNSESGQLDVDGETKDLLKSLGVCGVSVISIYLVLTPMDLQFDSIPVNVMAVAQQQTIERPRRFEGRPPRT